MNMYACTGLYYAHLRAFTLKDTDKVVCTRATGLLTKIGRFTEKNLSLPKK